MQLATLGLKVALPLDFKKALLRYEKNSYCCLQCCTVYLQAYNKLSIVYWGCQDEMLYPPSVSPRGCKAWYQTTEDSSISHRQRRDLLAEYWTMTDWSCYQVCSHSYLNIVKGVRHMHEFLWGRGEGGAEVAVYSELCPCIEALNLLQEGTGKPSSCLRTCNCASNISILREIH